MVGRTCRKSDCSCPELFRLTGGCCNSKDLVYKRASCHINQSMPSFAWQDTLFCGANSLVEPSYSFVDLPFLPLVHCPPCPSLVCRDFRMATFRMSIFHTLSLRPCLSKKHRNVDTFTIHVHRAYIWLRCHDSDVSFLVQSQLSYP